MFVDLTEGLSEWLLSSAADALRLYPINSTAAMSLVCLVVTQNGLFLLHKL